MVPVCTCVSSRMCASACDQVLIATLQEIDLYLFPGIFSSALKTVLRMFVVQIMPWLAGDKGAFAREKYLLAR